MHFIELFLTQFIVFRSCVSTEKAYCGRKAVIATESIFEIPSNRNCFIRRGWQFSEL